MEDINEMAARARWGEENDPKNDLLVELFGKLQRLPLSAWHLDERDVTTLGVKMGLGRGNSIYITLFGIEGEDKVIMVPGKMNDTWESFFRSIFNYLKEEKERKEESGETKAIKNAIAQIDKYFEDNPQKGGW